MQKIEFLNVNLGFHMVIVVVELLDRVAAVLGHKGLVQLKFQALLAF